MGDTSDMADRWRRFRLAFVRSPLNAWRLTSSVPDEVVPCADEPWFPLVTPAKGFAEDFYLGRFRLAGRLEERKTAPFAGLNDAPHDWTAALHGFGWLRPLRDEGTPLARAKARAMLADWIEAFGQDLRLPAWDPPIAARRLDAWLAHHEWLAHGGSAERNGAGRTRDRYLARHARALRLMAPATQATERVELGAALVFAQTALGIRGRGLAHVQAGLRGALARDGGPRSGDPREAVRLLALLRRIDADRAGGSTNGQSPSFLLDATNGLSGWLSALLHADGTLAQFRGAGWLPKALVETLLKNGSVPFAAGFARLEGKRGAVVVADRGSAEGFDGGGAFELSVPKGRIVVSCGVPERHGPLRDALKGSAAHSTLTVELPEGDAPGRAEPGAAEEADKETDRDEVRIATRRGPLLHRRTLAFEAEGLAGIDEVRGACDAPARFRFHLHPDVVAVREGAHAVSLTLGPGGSGEGTGSGPSSNPSSATSAERWTFHCVDASVRLEDTVVFAEHPDDWSKGRGRQSRQIVVDLPEGGEEQELRWMFVRQP